MNLRDFLILYTEISSLNWIFHENRPAAGSRVSFLENRGPIKPIRERGNAEQKKIKKTKSAHLLSIMIFLFFSMFFNEWAF